MELHGKSILGGKTMGGAWAKTFSAVNAVSGEKLAPLFYEATSAEADETLALAASAFEQYRALPPERIAEFLDQAAAAITELGDELLQRANLETALPEARLIGERARTVNQFKMFAEIIREGSWIEAAIDRAIPDRKPLPKSDLRRMLIPLGPVVVFGASNFPLAYSVGGGDTASALAAGCSVVVKAHPAHPGTSELVARAIQSAADVTKMPPGVFSMIQGAGFEIGIHLVKHPATKAVGFTGSLSGGRALFGAAAARPEPIPVYAEMGSTNPVFFLPGALKANGDAIAENFIQSVTLGAGQFCTNPGLAFGCEGEEWRAFTGRAGSLAGAVAPGVMLHRGILEKFEKGAARFQEVPGVSVAGKSSTEVQERAAAHVFLTDAKTFREESLLSEELFGPSTLLVGCQSAEELEQIARDLHGQLTATIHGTEEDLAWHQNLVAILRQKAGRLIFNQFPTGVEVCASMQHGGPYPATTDSRTTSVGAFAIKRFARPVCFQNFPDAALPVELQNKNSRNIWRLIDNQFTKSDI
ncbi:MAG TPA: aldehyde dehydrogenase (NADP(+)) [Candidatus Methylacidiphilales bacterium]|nr:aldehyde dehydrogenase (NADP(+)) [Candidatus Methylacidiphilales bacterium]